MFFILFLLTAATLFYVYVKWNFGYWKRNKVPGPDPTFFVGNIGSTLNMSEQWAVTVADIYNKYQNEPYVGYYKLLQPGLIVRDLDLLKDIFQNDFDHFVENDVALSKKYDPLLATNPFFLIGDNWKEARKTILPAFTSSKLKSIFPILNGVGEQLTDFIKSHPSETEFNAKELAVRYTVQTVIKSAFSIDPKCFDKENESEFVQMNRQLFHPSPLVALKFMAFIFFPQWMVDLIPIPFVTPSIDKFFHHLVNTNRASRSKANQSNDILQMLMQVQEKNNIKSELFLAGHSLALFTDGTETSSIALSFALYELARNPECQEKLYKEILEKLGTTEGKWNAEVLQEMIYLEAVLHESMRLNPPGGVLSKRCTKDYQLPKNQHQSEPIMIRRGTVINVPIMGIHMDPQHFPNPKEFKPERFFPEEQRNRHAVAYLAFGQGPRVCVGQRFAIAQTKVALAYIVKQFRIKLSPNHKPVVIDPQAFLTYPKDGILLQFETR